jgi:hypothetical protein
MVVIILSNNIYNKPSGGYVADREVKEYAGSNHVVVVVKRGTKCSKHIDLILGFLVTLY